MPRRWPTEAMPAAAFHLITDWSFAALRKAVWQALMAPEDWPWWWRAVPKVERLAEGDASAAAQFAA